MTMRIARHLTGLGIAVFLAACGLDNSSNEADSDTQVTAQEIQIFGAGIKGPLAFADTKIYALDPSFPDFYDPTAPIASAITNESAQITGLSVPAKLKPPFVLTIGGPHAIDLNTGKAPVIATLSTVITEKMLNERRAIYTTPLTTLVFHIARMATGSTGDTSLFLNTLDAEAQAVSTLFAIDPGVEIDVFSSPLVIDSTTRNLQSQEEAVHHRAALEAFAAKLYQMSQLPGNLTTDTLMKRLARDYQRDGVIDGTASGTPIEGIDTAILNQDAMTLTVPNTSYTIADIAALMEEERVLIGTSSGPDFRSESITLPVSGQTDIAETADSTSEPVETQPDPDPVISEPEPAPVSSDPDPATESATLPLDLKGTAPEQASIVVSVQKPAGSVNATLTLTAFDADDDQEGELIVNGNSTIRLFGEWGLSVNNQTSGTATFTMPASYWNDGDNTLLFRHLRGAGFIIEDIAVSFDSSNDVTVPDTTTPDSDPVVSDPVVSDPVVSDPVVSDPVVSDPVVSDPVVSDPVVSDPVVSDPVVSDPVTSDPTTGGPAFAHVPVPSGRMNFAWYEDAKAMYTASDDPMDWAAAYTSAASHTAVASCSQLQNALNQAGPGSMILVESGEYNGCSLSIARSGTQAAPIVVTASAKALNRSGTVTFKGGSTFANIRNGASHYVIGGFRFRDQSDSVFEIEPGDMVTDGSGKTVYKAGSTDIRFTDSHYQGIGRASGSRKGLIQVGVRSHRIRVDHSAFVSNYNHVRYRNNKDAGAKESTSKDARVDHNYFGPAATSGFLSGVPYEMGAIQTCCGSVSESADALTLTFEYNVVEHPRTSNTDPEVVEAKTPEMVIRNNIIWSTGAAISLRQSFKSTVEANYLVGTGIMVHGGYHVIADNYIDGNGRIKAGITMPRWGRRQPDNCTTLPATHDNLITGNVILDTSEYGMRIGDCDYGACRPVTDSHIADNYLQSDSGVLIHFNTKNESGRTSACSQDRSGDADGGSNTNVTFNSNSYFGSASRGSAFQLDDQASVQ